MGVQSPFGVPRAPRRKTVPKPRANTVFSAPVGRVSPVGASPSQKSLRGSARRVAQRQEITTTRQIVGRQQEAAAPLLGRIPNPRLQTQYVAKQQEAAVHRAAHIAAHQTAAMLAQIPNPRQQVKAVYTQALTRLHQANDIGRLTSIWQNPHAPLEHRVGALRTLRTRYAVPVTQEGFKGFRKAQAFHQFLTSGSEGETFTLPTPVKPGTFGKTSQTFQLRKVNGKLTPLAVDKRPILSLGGLVHGHPYKDQYVPIQTAHQAIASQSGGIASGFTKAGVDTAHYGAKLIPSGTVGTPLKRGVTELAALGPNTITGLYGLASAGVEAAKGNTAPIKAIGKSFSQDDPVGRLITHGDFKAFAKHPGIAAAELLGGFTGADRIAGKVVRGGGPAEVRSVRGVPLTRLGRQDRYSQGLIASKVQKARDVRVDTRFGSLQAEARAEVAKARAAQGRVVKGTKAVERPAQQRQVYDPRAARKAIARQERRRLDRPFIRTHEVQDFQKGSKVTGVLYHVTTPENAAKIHRAGIDPGKAQRGTFGLGSYSGTTPESAAGKAIVRVAVRLKNPLTATNDTIERAIAPFRQRAAERVGIHDKRALMVETTKELQRAGYDGVVIKGASPGKGNYVLNFHPEDVKVVSGKTTVRRGGRTSAVKERNLPPEQATVAPRTVRVTTRQRVGADPEAVSGHLHKAEQLAAKAEKYNRARVREGFNLGSPHRAQLRSDLERVGDVTEGTNQAAQRSGRTGTIQQLAGKHAIREKNRQPGVLQSGAAGEVQGLIAEARVAPHRVELQKVADRLAGQEKFLADHHQIATNRHLVGAIREVLKTHTDAQLRVLGDDAHRYARVNVNLHDLAKQHDIISHEEASMSAAKPFAVEQMGARPNKDGKLVVVQKAPVDLSHWEHRVRIATDDLQRAKQRGAARVELTTKEGRLREAQAALEARAAKGRTVDVEHVLTLDEIHRGMHAYADKFPGALRPGEQAFISHSSRSVGSGAFNIRADTAKGLSRARRTGAAVLYGTASVGRDAMLAAAVKLRNMVTASQSFRQMVSDAATRDPVRGGGLIAEDSAKAALARHNVLMTDPKTGLPVPGAVEGVAVRLNPFGGRAEQFTRTLHEADEEGFLPGEKHPVAEQIQSALEGKDVGSGPWTVLPKPFVDRLLEHARVSGGSSAFLRSVTSAFRHTVLPFSPTWITGNALESLGRGAIAGWRPGDTQLEQRVFSEWATMDAITAQRSILSIGTGHMGSVSAWKVRNTANALHSGPLRPLHQLAEKILNAQRLGKPVRIGTNAIRVYTDWMLNDVNGAMETAIKHGLVGTQMRKLFLPKDLGAKTEEAVKAIAGELHSNPAAVQELISSVQRAYGAYENFSPEMRRFITNYTPFGAWVFNAVTFLTRVLPADHPGLVALLAANDSATRTYRRDHGLDATIAGEKNSGQVPPFLLGSIPTPAWYARLVGAEKGAPLRLARYTPLGIATDPTSTFASMFLPQLPLEALQGYDFTGRQLRNKDGSPYDDSQKAGYFAKNFALATIPLFGQIVRGVQKGPLAVINPVQPVARKAQKSTGSGWGPALSGTASWAPAGSASGNSWAPKP